MVKLPTMSFRRMTMRSYQCGLTPGRFLCGLFTNTDSSVEWFLLWSGYPHKLLYDITMFQDTEALTDTSVASTHCSNLSMW